MAFPPIVLPTEKRTNNNSFIGIKSKLLKKRQYTRFSFYRNNISYFITIGIYLLLSIFFVLLQLLVLYPNLNVWLCFARACGILLDFNSVLIILLVLRHCNTWLRNSVIGRNYLVLDESLNFHKIIGFIILILGFVHTIAHAINLCELILRFKFTWSVTNKIA